ncbi:carbohydrate binding domain-containing protein [Serratia bockelmannii]|uniref:carbohydrate binding domain-containing protein n=1 Tax=Serratia bockelmannii TaxID=2703793 RepID=UPI00236104CC|nr:carbohydrate binding domain-containing protein [Serratia bockelmannii]
MSENLIKNGDFTKIKDNKVSEWGFSRTFGALSEVVGEMEVKKKKPYCKVGSTETIRQPINIKSGKVYEISLNVCGELGGKISLNYHDEPQPLWVQELPDEKQKNEWIEVKFTFNSPSEVKRGLELQIHGNPMANPDDTKKSFLNVADILVCEVIK